MVLAVNRSIGEGSKLLNLTIKVGIKNLFLGDGRGMQHNDLHVIIYVNILITSLDPSHGLQFSRNI